jgi:hypothetical protein
MPLSDLEALGLQTSVPALDPAGNPMPGRTTAYRYGGRGQQWFQELDETEDEFVARVTKKLAIHDKLDQARAYFRTQYTNWPTMTAGQKDAATRNLMRAMANVIGWIEDADDGGD